MIARNPDRQRLKELMQFAAAYRGWTVKQLGEALNRDPSNVVPESGTPKVDLVIRLAEALDWPVGDLLEHLSEPAPPPADTGAPLGRAIGRGIAAADHRRVRGTSPVRAIARMDDSTATATEEPPCSDRAPQDVIAEASSLLASGDLDGAIELSGSLERCSDIELRLESALLHAAALDRRGRPMRALATLQRAARQAGGPWALRLEVMTRLAVSYHRTGQPIEAGALAADALGLASTVPADAAPAERIAFAVALAHAVRAECLRDAVLDGEDDPARIESARTELDRAAAALGGIDSAEAAGIALVVEAGQVSVETCAGSRSVTSAINETLRRIDDAIDPSAVADEHRLAGIGWWCVLIGTAAIRRSGDGPELHRALAILTNKADEIAAAVDCWALRERLLCLEHDRRMRLAAFAGHEDPWLLDRDDLRMVIGCMGASQRFRAIGTRILRSALLVQELAI